jgi:hypothetical protein
MLYLNFIYERMEEAGEALLDDGGRLRNEAIATLVRESARLETTENRARLETIDRCYRKLGGRYAAFAEAIAPRDDELIERARTDIEEFALLTEAWPTLVEACRAAASSLPPAAEWGGTS